MKYEIPREMFKQRLENRLNFVVVDVRGGAPFENVVPLPYSETSSSSVCRKATRLPRRQPMP